MKIKKGYLLRETDTGAMVIPLNTEENMAGVITLNDVGAYLWQKMETETTAAALTEALLARYDVDRTTAAESVTEYVTQLRLGGFLEE